MCYWSYLSTSWTIQNNCKELQNITFFCDKDTEGFLEELFNEIMYQKKKERILNAEVSLEEISNRQKSVAVNIS